MRIGVGLLAVLALTLLVSVAQAGHPSSPARMAVAAGPAKAPPARSLAAATGNDRRYALANGCYALRSPAAGGLVAKDLGGYRATAGSAGEAEGFRMQATALGSYLFYGRDRDFMAGNATTDLVAPADGASPAAEWTVDANADGTFKVTLPSAGKALGVAAGRLVLADPAGAAAFAFEPAGGCAIYPEAETSATGRPFTSKTPWGEIKGIIDLHLHMTAFEFLGGKVHCGRPWHPYGAPYALVDCEDHKVANGCGAVLENALYGQPVRCHDPVGWPTFKDWPHHDSLTHEQTYYKWLERAYMGGLRLFVNLYVDNRVLCELYPLKQNNCDEMASVRLQDHDLNAIQDYVDAQNGGPGRGWFRIVHNPFEARRVIAAGKLAVVKGIEVSEPFGCRVYNDQPQCDREQIDRELEQVHAMGVRQMELINKFDNALAGVAGDSGETGLVVNAGNRLSTGKFWQMQHCTGPEDEQDKQQVGVYDHDETDVQSNLIEHFLPPGAAPVYPMDSNCNARGLTDLGDHAVRRLMEKRMMIDPDHLSVKARKSVMDLLEAERYSGGISSHSWSTADVIPRIYDLGGVVTPMKEAAPGWIETWRVTKAQRDPRFYFGIGYGSDQNGLSSQPEPRTGADQVQYPFKSIDGRVTFERQRSGAREFDFTKDGVAHYGLFPDWWEDIRRVGGEAAIRDMTRGAEAYLQAWERVEGVGFGCKLGIRRFTRRGLGRIHLRDGTARLLRRGGQPRVRGNSAWTWCVRGKQNRRKKIAAALTRDGKVALVASNAKGANARRVRVGDPVSRLAGARKLGKRLYVRGAGPRGRFVYGVRRGRVRFVAVATRAASKNRAALRRNLRLARFL
jgi:microsomal dipeptidase-like Zn-dependent dipeptidase